MRAISGITQLIDGRTVEEVIVDNEKLEADPVLCYLGDIISARGGSELVVIIAANVLRQALQTAPLSHRMQSAASDQKLGVFNMHKKSGATCSMLDHDGSYTELTSAH